MRVSLPISSDSLKREEFLVSAHFESPPHDNGNHYHVDGPKCSGTSQGLSRNETDVQSVGYDWVTR